MCWEAQAVMLLRSMRIAKGGPRAEAKTQRMIAEKVAALAQAQIAAMVATLKGGKKGYGTPVTATRLSYAFGTDIVRRSLYAAAWRRWR